MAFNLPRRARSLSLNLYTSGRLPKQSATLRVSPITSAVCGRTPALKAYGVHRTVSERAYGHRLRSTYLPNGLDAKQVISRVWFRTEAFEDRLPLRRV